ncbi:hypothetical protein [Actinoallomurus sp. NPDC050550]|uniref:hypothetical protein n=1 Tax=Actinoallomurus sp. NPDC050550 TaxID=3154937 RepID=UPI0033E5CABF
MAEESAPISRTRLRLWWAAVALTALPLALGMAATLLGAPDRFGFASVATKVCQGWQAEMRLASEPAWAVLKGVPVVVVGPAFAGWVLSRRRGLHRAAAWIGWTAPAFLAVIALTEPALVAFDGVQDCLDAWGPMLGFSLWPLYYLLPAGCAVAALRGSRRRPRRRRALGAVIMTAVLLAAMTADRGAERPISEPDACANAPSASPVATETPAQAIARLPRPRRELAFLCAARGSSLTSPGGLRPAHQEGRSDQDLLAMGRRVCDALGRTAPGDQATASLLTTVAQEWTGGEDVTRTAAYLCPDAAARWSPRLGRSARQEAEEAARYQTRMNAACARPRLAGAPTRQATTALFVGEGGGYYASDGEPTAGDPFNAAIGDGLISAAGNTAAIMTEIEDGPVCLTVAAYRHRPPLMLRGWDRVAEVGVDSPHGGLRVTTMEEMPRLPILASTGPGPYRLRVYVRDREKAERSVSDLPVERHLIVVFPGRSTKTTVYRNAER